MSSRRTSLRMTRRQWAAGLTAVIGAAPAVAQVSSKTPPQRPPAPVHTAVTPEQKLQKAYADVQEIRIRLSQIEVSMDIEPAFAFRA
jgi:ferric-dicitrate binding protein FerR (iron transport regulator)